MSEHHIIKSDYFQSSIYNIYKPEWVDKLNALSDPHIESRKIKDLNKLLEVKRSSSLHQLLLHRHGNLSHKRGQSV